MPLCSKDPELDELVFIMNLCFVTWTQMFTISNMQLFCKQLHWCIFFPLDSLATVMNEIILRGGKLKFERSHQWHSCPPSSYINYRTNTVFQNVTNNFVICRNFAHYLLHAKHVPTLSIAGTLKYAIDLQADEYYRASVFCGTLHTQNLQFLNRVNNLHVLYFGSVFG